MPKFSYSARDKLGQKLTGVEEGNSVDEIAGRLQARGLLVINIALQEEGAKPAELKQVRRVFKRSNVTNDDKVLFSRQLATLIGAGITILKSLQVIREQTASRKFYYVIKDLEKKMEGGLSFHEAMRKHASTFSSLWANLIESGEASGNLAIILERLAGYLERNAAFKKKIISALAYPMILTSVGLLALFVLTVKIIPTFAQLFGQFNMKLPFLTQVIMGMSDAIRKNLVFIFAGGIAGFVFLRGFLETKPGRMQYENILMKLPVFGEFFRALAVERFTSEMSTLVESGVPILYALEIAERGAGSLIMGEIIKKVRNDVREGKPLSEPLRKSGFFDPMVVQMINIGEEIGELPNMFKRLNIFYQEYIDTFLTRFTAMFEPIMLLFMGAVIGIMVIGMFLPIFQLSQIH